MAKVAAVIVAGGLGKRMGGNLPKQFLELAGKPILQHTLECFNRAAIIDDIYVVLPEAYVGQFHQELRDEWGITKIRGVVCGGGERHQSVWAGITALPESIEIVMIHDGVRPFVAERILVDSVNAAREYGAAVVGLMPKDTIKLLDHDKVQQTIDRSKILLAQTPQTFQIDVIRKANLAAMEKNQFSTDDAALVEQMGGTVHVVLGDWKNIKITSPEDLIIAKVIWEQTNADRSRF